MCYTVSHFDLDPHHVRVLLALRASILVLEVLIQKGASVGHTPNEHLLGQEIEPSPIHGKSLALDINLVRLGGSTQPDGNVLVAPICRIYGDKSNETSKSNVASCIRTHRS